MNIWYQEKEVLKLEKILEKLNKVKTDNYWKIVKEKEILENKYNKILRYFQKPYWLDKNKITKLEKINNNTDTYCSNIKFVISNIKDIWQNYQNLCHKDTYGNVLAQENYEYLYEKYVTIRNYLENMSNEKMVMSSNYIKSEMYGVYYKLEYGLMFVNNPTINYDLYHNNDWYMRVKGYQDIIEIYNDALVESWPYEKFYHISNAFKFFKQMELEETKKHQEELVKEDKKLEDLPSFLILSNPHLIKIFDKKTLLQVKKKLIRELSNTSEKEQDIMIERLYQINLTKKM